MSKCSRYALNRNLDHDIAVKRIVRYLAVTSDLRLQYSSRKKKAKLKKLKVNIYSELVMRKVRSHFALNKI